MQRNIAQAICQLTIVVLISISARVADAQTVKVACVGDSITALPSSWCGDLSTKLGSGYMVQNFGVSGTNLAKGVSQPYWSSAQYTPSHTFAPNIVIIMLGTNDAFSASWSGAKTHFLKDYEELLDTYTSLASKPKPYIIVPTPIGTSPFGHDGNLLATEVVPLVKQVAMEKMVPTVDAFTLFGGAMFDAGLYGGSDQVHPNAKGQQLICDEVYKVLMSTGALGGSATAGSGATAGTGASAGSGGMAATAGAMAMAGASANAGGVGSSGAGTVTPTGASGSGANVGGSATAGSSANTGSTATAAGSMSLAGATGSVTAGNSSSVNGIGVAGSAGRATTAPPSSNDGGCRTAGSSSTNSGPTAALVLLVGLAIRRRWSATHGPKPPKQVDARFRRQPTTFRNGAHLS
jgi:acyl-CoA thioesterase-1